MPPARSDALARAAEKYGADIGMLALMNNVAWSCPLPRRGSDYAKPQKYGARCGIDLHDLGEGGPPPEMPPVALWIVKPDAAE